MDSESTEEPKEETYTAQVAAEAASLLLNDDDVKKLAGMSYAGMMMNHFSYQELLNKLEGYKDYDEETCSQIVEKIYMTIREESKAGCDVQHMLRLMRESSLIVADMLNKLITKQKQEAKVMLDKGFELPFVSVRASRAKPGNVLILSGDKDEVNEAFEAAFDKLNLDSVPVTYCRVGSSNVPDGQDKRDGLGVLNIPLKWWDNGCSDLNKAKETFDGVDTPVLLIEDATKLRSELATGADVQQLRKVLGQIAKRKRVAIIAAVPTSDIDMGSKAGKVCNVKVERVDGVLLVDDESVKEYTNGEEDTSDSSGGDGSSEG